MNDFSFQTIAIVHSCFKEKFGIPRQSGLVESAKATVELIAPYNQESYVRELESFSHIWLVFVFHQHINKEIKSTVRPPRLGGNKRIGVFASRSSFRPNPIGLSAVKLNKITTDSKKVLLHISGADLLDGTPIIDIKPYIGYADTIPEYNSGYANIRPEKILTVEFKSSANDFLINYPELKQLIIETVSLDPRPAYITDSSKVYGICLDGFNIKWAVENDSAIVFEIIV